MGAVGCLAAIFALFFAVLGAFPFLGWLNWITTLPLALLAIVFSAISLSPERRSPLAVLGLGAGILILCWAVFRLAVGGGVL
jgi:hypothetical protein